MDESVTRAIKKPDGARVSRSFTLAKIALEDLRDMAAWAPEDDDDDLSAREATRLANDALSILRTDPRKIL